jgi:glycosyltransferase involved in cell wall biosynthesis
MRKKIRILHVMNGAVLGGISTVVLNYYRNIDRDRFKFDIAMYNKKLGPNGEELKRLGCEMFYLPLKSRHLIKYIKKLNGIIKNGRYDVIHVHSNKTSFVALISAKVLGIPVRIAHAHTAYKNNSKTTILDVISHFITSQVANKLLACSNEAAISIFGESNAAIRKTIILNNAIDVEKFRFDPNVRKEVRKKLGIGSELVIGTVGNLGPEKNQKYLLEVFKALVSLNQNVKLIIVGKGKLMNDLKTYSNELGVADKVFFLGQRTDVNLILMAMDIFVMTSIYEGFGIAALEAAASGLPIYLSKNIPKDFQFVKRHKYISLDVNPIVWAKELNECELKYNRLDGAEEVINNGFSINENIHQLEKIYEKNFEKYKTK